MAIEPPPGVRAALADWATAAVGDDPAFRLVEPAAMHLTLAFLGERPEADVARLGPELARALGRCEPPREARVSAPLWLAPRRPHVLTVAVDDVSGRLSALQSAVVTACVRAIGWEPEGRPFHPHVTVARVRRDRHVAPRELAPLPEGARQPWRTGAGVALLRSSPGQGAAQYEALWGGPA
ncbi:MAG: RNA 2',3'-cyclic phosphodiesterase [Solirubrobacterales bacterium]|nr:RNA 2',3'-cyclic phosphodiesterase [Solirubrobacterales bacterium]